MKAVTKKIRIQNKQFKWELKKASLNLKNVAVKRADRLDKTPGRVEIKSVELLTSVWNSFLKWSFEMMFFNNTL